MKETMSIKLLAKIAGLPALIVALAILASPTRPASAEEGLGRLFFTPEYRQTLDRQRQLAPHDKRGLAESTTLTIDGVVTRDSGKRTVWINGMPQNDDAPLGNLIVAPRKGNPGEITIETPNAPLEKAGVGDSINRNTGEKTDLLNGGEIRVNDKRRPENQYRGHEMPRRGNNGRKSPFEDLRSPPPAFRHGQRGVADPADRPDAVRLFIEQLNSARHRFSQAPTTSAALSEAKQALIGDATAKTAIENAGYLRLPDVGTNGFGVPTEGNSAANFAGNNLDLSVIGKFPWKTLGTAPLRDAGGECLWYVLSGRFKVQPQTAALN